MTGPMFQAYVKNGGFSYTSNRVTGKVFPVAFPVRTSEDTDWQMYNCGEREYFFSLTTYASTIFNMSYGLNTLTFPQTPSLPVVYDSYNDNGVVEQCSVAVEFVKDSPTTVRLLRLPIVVNEVPNAVMLDANLLVSQNLAATPSPQYTLSGVTIYIKE